MTYQEAIREAKISAKKNNINYIVFYLRKRHWWNRTHYGYLDADIFEDAVFYSIPFVKLLTITPSGTVAQ